MTIPFGRHCLNVTVTRAPDPRKRWEELVAAGLSDRELARLNECNTRDFDGAAWTGPRLIIRSRRP